MIWQDVVLAGGGFVFSIAMIPTIRGGQKPELVTSGSTALILTIFVFTYASLNLWLSVFSTSLTAATWYILAIQKYRQK